MEKTSSFAQREVIDSCANWIGAHALPLLLMLFLITLGVISVLWQLFVLKLWAHPDGWRRHVLERPFTKRLQQCYPLTWRFFVARLTPDGSLGLHLTIGLLITLAAMLGFSALADAVRGFLPISAKSPRDLFTALWPRKFGGIDRGLVGE